MTLALVTPPKKEPVSLEDAKAHLRVTGSEEDALIESLISAARGHLEDVCRRAFLTQTWELRADLFPAVLEPPFPPFQSVTSLKYIDTAGVEQTLSPSAYTVDSHTPRIVPVYGTTWPATRDVPNAVILQYVCGWTSPDAIPTPIKQALLMLTGHLYEHREGVLSSDKGSVSAMELPFAVNALIAPWRVVRF